MPIKIYNTNKFCSEIDWLCSDSWDLAEQIDCLAEWLNHNKSTLEKGNYVADIGFVNRKDATGGGGVITTEMMRVMTDLEMDLLLSEYGCDVKSKPKERI